MSHLVLVLVLVLQNGKTSRHTPKCGPPSPTRMTWRCRLIPCAHGRLGSFGPSSYPVSINFSTFDIPVSPLARFVAHFPTCRPGKGCGLLGSLSDMT
jgi:hypothetical protein